MTEFLIADRMVGYDHDPLVIVEIGINHEGSLDTAKQMVDAAVTAGAEIIKHQTHVIEDEMSDEARAIIPGNADESIYEIMARCALSENDELALKEYVESKGAIFISTPFSRAAVDRLLKMNVPAFKIGSSECNNFPLIEYIASFGKPVILSTGMNDIGTVRKAVHILRQSNIPFGLMHTTNLYPTPPELVRLGAMVELQEEFPDAVVGLSDHTTSNHACFGAVALGASLLERHFTDDMGRPGPDIVCSMDPKALTELISGSNLLKKARGGVKACIPEEEVTRKFAYASVVATKPIPKGDELTVDNIWVKRPGTGDYCAEEFQSLLGRRTKRAVEAHKQLRQEDLE